MELCFQRARTTKYLDFTLQLKTECATGGDEVLNLAQAAAVSDLWDFLVYRIGEAAADLAAGPLLRFLAGVPRPCSSIRPRHLF